MQEQLLSEYYRSISDCLIYSSSDPSLIYTCIFLWLRGVTVWCMPSSHCVRGKVSQYRGKWDKPFTEKNIVTTSWSLFSPNFLCKKQNITSWLHPSVVLFRRTFNLKNFFFNSQLLKNNVLYGNMSMKLHLCEVARERLKCTQKHFSGR